MSATTDISVEAEIGLIKNLLNVATSMVADIPIDRAPGTQVVDTLASLLIAIRDRAEALDASYAAILSEGAVPCC